MRNLLSIKYVQEVILGKYLLLISGQKELQIERMEMSCVCTLKNTYQTRKHTKYNEEVDISLVPRCTLKAIMRRYISATSTIKSSFAASQTSTRLYVNIISNLTVPQAQSVEQHCECRAAVTLLDSKSHGQS